MVMPKFKITKTYEFTITAKTEEDALFRARSLYLKDDLDVAEDITSTDIKIEEVEEPINVAYTGWETLIKQGIDEWKFEYEISSYELYVDGDLYHLKQQLHTYWDFVEYAKLFVKGEAECLK